MAEPFVPRGKLDPRPLAHIVCVSITSVGHTGRSCANVHVCGPKWPISCVCAYLFVGHHGRPCALCEPNIADIPNPPPAALTEDFNQNDLGMISYETSGIEMRASDMNCIELL